MRAQRDKGGREKKRNGGKEGKKERVKAHLIRDSHKINGKSSRNHESNNVSDIGHHHSLLAIKCTKIKTNNNKKINKRTVEIQPGSFNFYIKLPNLNK